MNAYFFPRSFRWLLLFTLAVVCVPLFTTDVLAAEGSTVAACSLQANLMFELVSDRARLIQVSLVMVTIGIGLLWWSR